MKISMVSEQASPLGRDLGQGAHVAELSAAMTALGHEVTVYTRRAEPDSPERMRTGDGYELVRVCAGPAEELNEDAVVAHLGDFAGFLPRVPSRVDDEARARLPATTVARPRALLLPALLGARRSPGRPPARLRPPGDRGC